MNYRVEILGQARKALDKLPRGVAATILEGILGLEENPRPRQSLKMQGRPERWRLPMGEYRVIYAVSDAAKIVFVHDVLRRTGQTYR